MGNGRIFVAFSELMPDGFAALLSLIAANFPAFVLVVRGGGRAPLSFKDAVGMSVLSFEGDSVWSTGLAAEWLCVPH